MCGAAETRDEGLAGPLRAKEFPADEERDVALGVPVRGGAEDDEVEVGHQDGDGDDAEDDDEENRERQRVLDGARRRARNEREERRHERCEDA